mgnify:CR=1 FL=1
MKKLLQLIAIAGIAISASAFAQKSNDNWVNSTGIVWKNGTNELCWRNANWTPATAAPGCDGALAGTAAPAVSSKVTYNADALFDFGKSDAASISYNGQGELDKLISRLHTRYGSFDKKQIHIVGYADPLGTDAVNKRLSVARANTIKNYMIAGGIPASKITSEGRGSSSPIVANCPRVATPESIACNKPNRRVVVGVAVLTR